jgi:hypothetical protein
MDAGYDGSIRVDTSIDSKGFNAGVKGITATLKKVALAIAGAFAIGAVIRFVRMAAMAIGRLFKDLDDSLSKTSAFRTQIDQLSETFSDLKGAFLAAFATLLIAATPAINAVVSWMIQMLNTISMVIASMAGMKTVMQYVAGSAEKAAKAAKGALAGFDEINVLQQPNEAAGAGTMQFQEVAVPADYAKTVWESFKTWFHDHIIQPIKDWIAQAWDSLPDWFKNLVAHINGFIITAVGLIISFISTANGFLLTTWEKIKTKAGEVRDWIVEKWGKFSEWFKTTITEPLQQWFKETWEKVKQWASDTWQSIVDKWNNAPTWFQTLVDSIKAKFSDAWENIKQKASDAWQSIVDKWNNAPEWFRTNVIESLKNKFSEVWENIKTWAGNAWENVKQIWANIGAWFTTNITDPIKEAFKTALDWVSEKWNTVFAGVTELVKNSVNTVIDFINGMISAIAGGLNSVIGSLNSISVEVPSWVPVYGGQTWGINLPTVSAPQIPHLATGAVIPPNSRFLAMLGDQRSGTNIEAPADLIRQIVREEVGQQQTDISVSFGGSMGELVRMLQPEIKRETVRRGKLLIQPKGSTA